MACAAIPRTHASPPGNVAAFAAAPPPCARPATRAFPDGLREADRRTLAARIAGMPDSRGAAGGRTPTDPVSPGSGTFGEERRRTECRRFTNGANIYADHAWTLDACGAATPYRGKCELAPTTAPLTHAQDKYSKRFLVAFGRPRSPAVPLRRLSAMKFSAPRTDPHRNGGLALTVTIEAEPVSKPYFTALDYTAARSNHYRHLRSLPTIHAHTSVVSHIKRCEFR